ncbi:MAG: histidinol dehydrogenase [Solirubrobacterales bacterium]|nr:histidinol dehydrogenase [Solirubrobacterales bacterium]
MRCERLTLSGGPAALAAELRELVPPPESVRETVAEIIARVRASGDDALRFYTRELDTGGSTPSALRVPDAELDTAAERLSDELRAALRLAVGNVMRVAEPMVTRDQTVGFDGHDVRLREVAVDRAAIYVPGGRAPYPSTVVMGVVAARVAGVREIAVCSPPGSDGELDATVLGACRLAGASVAYRMGGAQAIAALAYGSETVSAVDVIVGPGNLYVQEAKRQVVGHVGIDGFAGPSDLILVAAAPAEELDAEALALDLLAQAEHGAGSIVIAISDSGELLNAFAERIESAPDTEAVVRLVQVSELEQALGISEAFAPEHLQLAGAGAEALADQVRHAGCVLVGAASGTAFADYVAGSNHVLPTNGAARFASALSPHHFRRRISEVRIGEGASALARAAAPLARAEGFELHAESMEARIHDNDGA